MRITDVIPWGRKKKKTKVPVKVPEQTAPAYQRETNRRSDELSRWFGLAPLRDFGSWADVFRPRLDLVEDGKEFRVTVEVPGFDKGDIHVALSADRLTVQGEKRGEEVHRSRGAYSRQRSREAFRRSVVMPCHVDADRVEAALSKGILTISLPKADGARSRTRIPIGNRQAQSLGRR